MTYNVDELLEFIAWPESRGDIDIVYGGIKLKDRPPNKLSTMTIGEVLAWQDSIDSQYPSEAAGKFQIMEDTLRGLYKQAGLTAGSLYSASNQRKLAIALLQRRGLDKYLSGSITTLKFADNLSKEWASLPATIKDREGRPARGQSYYAGDGLNRSHVSIADLLAKVATVKVTTPLVVDNTDDNITMKTIMKCLRGV
jgi:muramidase (phage lysozyme)